MVVPEAADISLQRGVRNIRGIARRAAVFLPFFPFFSLLSLSFSFLDDAEITREGGGSRASRTRWLNEPKEERVERNERGERRRGREEERERGEAENGGPPVTSLTFYRYPVDWAENLTNWFRPLPPPPSPLRSLPPACPVSFLRRKFGGIAFRGRIRNRTAHSMRRDDADDNTIYWIFLEEYIRHTHTHTYTRGGDDRMQAARARARTTDTRGLIFVTRFCWYFSG